MAWASVGSLGTASSVTADQASLVLTTSATLAVGQVGVIVVACDNFATTTGDEGAVSGVADSAGGNTWVKALEFTNPSADTSRQQFGAVCSVWYCKAATQLTSGGTITASFTNATARDATAATGWIFSNAGTVSVAGSATAADNGAAPSSLDVTTANAEFLRIRGIGTESDTETLTATASWTKFTDAVSGGATIAGMVAQGEFRIVTATNAASAPTTTNAVRDRSSVYVALLETPIPPKGRRPLIGVGR